MGRYEVTQELWERVMHANPSRYRAADMSHMPVENVSRSDCLDFIAELNRQNETSGFRLPLDAEWEYAAVADSIDMRASGIYGRRRKPEEVGTLEPNAWGLCDMFGNVAEWCEDQYPAELLNAFQRDGFVLRGGSYADRAESCLPNSRRREKSRKRHPTFGMRLCFSVNQ